LGVEGTDTKVEDKGGVEESISNTKTMAVYFIAGRK